MFGYTRQYASAAAAIYHGLQTRQLRWVGVADRCAGIADDVVLGFDDEVIGHQFKSSRDPDPFRIATLLTGGSGLLPGLLQAWQELKASCPDVRIRLRVVVDDTPSGADRVGNGGSTREFVAEWQGNPDRSLAEWSATPWGPFVHDLQAAAGLKQSEFEDFFQHLELVHGDQPNFAALYGITSRTQPQVDRIADRLPHLVARVPERDRWTRAEFLEQMSWPENEPRHRHQFPVGVAVQRNPSTEAQLQRVVRGNPKGYVSLVGPPGSGKSTLLQIALEAEPQLVVVRYLAYVPGGAQGIGRGESADFLEDVAAGLRNTGLQGVRFLSENERHRREELEALLGQAGERFTTNGLRTLIIVDGLDHVPREERPTRSFLADLPLPSAVPAGVLFILGTQLLDLPDIPPAVRDQASVAERRVEMQGLSVAAIADMADALGVPTAVSRPRLHELTRGHPLATHYLLQALVAAEDDATRDRILREGFQYLGEIDELYAATLRGLREDNEVLDILGLVARAEAPLDPRDLESLYQPAAIERTWRQVRHLLKRSGQAWSIFHNSFRLFLIRLKPTRYGLPDADYSASAYRKLANLAAQAPANSPQHFLAARYLMRAGAHVEALALATPTLLRAQYLAGRAASEIRADIRLAFRSLQMVVDPTAAFTLILAADEMSRRAEAFDEPDESIRALLALGRLDEGEDFLDEVGGDGFLVVDAWLKQGNLDRARTLFEQIEPLHDLGIGRMSSGYSMRVDEFGQWAERASEFRSLAELVAGIDRIVEALRRELGPTGEPEEIGTKLRERAARAVLARNPLADRDALIADLRLDPTARALLAAQAARQLLADGEDRLAQATAALAEAVADAAALAQVSPGLRRATALLAVRRGFVPQARALYDGASTKGLNRLDDATNLDQTGHVVRAVMESAELGVWMNLPVPRTLPPRINILRPLEQFALETGQLAAHSRRAPNTVAAGSATRLCASFMRYVCRAGTGGGDEHFGALQLERAAPKVLGSLLQSASRLGASELAGTVAAFDQVLGEHPHQGGRHTPLQILVAEAMARMSNDVGGAQVRLEALLAQREIGTPSQFLASTARLAQALARIGRTERAHELLAQQRGETLGYALPAKKDPQYAFWANLLQAANRADPRGRAHRVRVLTRQAIGMSSTEGRDAAHRLAHVLVVEAAADSAALASSVGDALLAHQLIGFPAMIDGLMKGTVRRDPTRVLPCVELWVALCLPFHRAVYYRESEEGEFLQEAIRLAAPEQVGCVRNRLLENIERHALIDVRPDALAALRAALLARGEDASPVDAALQRLEGVPHLRRRMHSSPTRYDSVSDMVQLIALLDTDRTGVEISYGATMAFVRLLPDADLPGALALFDRHPKLQADYQCRFGLVDRALAAGDHTTATRLVAAYPLVGDGSSRWSWMWGGGLRRYFAARLQLEGEAVFHKAYDNFTATLVGGEESVSALLWDADDIWPVLTASPDWAAMWAAVEEQLPSTRDYRLGEDVSVDAVQTDATLAASLIERMLSLPVTDVRWHAGRAALALASADPNTFAHLMLSLLANDEDDVVIDGLRLMHSATCAELKSETVALVVGLIAHADFGIGELARQLATRWGRESDPVRTPMPAFYSFALPPIGAPDRADQLRAQPFGPPSVSDPAAWSAPFPDAIELLAQIAGVSEDHVRHRVQQLIDGWGGVEAFGQAGINCLSARLSMFGLHSAFFYPHVMAALRALRRVAGELAAAGRIPGDQVDDLLLALNLAPAWLRTDVDLRPAFVRRPVLPEGGGDEEAWLEGVSEDVAHHTSADFVLGEITCYRGRYLDFRYEWSQLRLLGALLNMQGDPTKLVHILPTGSPVELVARPKFGAMPPWEMVINPHITEQLHWRTVDQTTWHDVDGEMMATAYSWRDGRPDTEPHGEHLGGEGAAIVLTAAGRKQWEAVRGSARTDVLALRRLQYEGKTYGLNAHARHPAPNQSDGRS
ncbi:ATP-binding protein [Stenotrophomonas maltophilia]|uniref:ATP-binding protein n=2 Tax=Lysobacteraceae TaxID=32033 RepID=UPI0021CA7E2F|nr:ATP-binding protein [Stenotrophomonas maltophilia]MCU1029703.1 ATP-binding protein [Stenotrophomonas maltophilia]